MQHLPATGAAMRQVVTQAELRRMARNAPAVPRDQKRAEVRIMATFITGGFVYGMVKAAYWVMLATGTLHRVASVSSLPNWVIGLAFVTCGLATLPHLLSLMFAPQLLHYEWPRKVAAHAALVSGVIWLHLCVVALKLDFGAAPWVWFGNTIGCLIVSGIYGFSVNAQQIRDRDAKDDCS